MNVVEWCMSGAKDFRFIGSEFHKSEDELQNERSGNLSLVETGGRERHIDQRNNGRQHAGCQPTGV